MNQKQSTLFSAVAYSYICFIDDYLAVLNNPVYTSIRYTDTSIQTILTDMQTLFLSMPTLLSGQSEAKESYTNKLVDYRKLLEEKYRVLHGLQRELQHTTTFFNLRNASLSEDYDTFGMSKEEANELDFTQLAKDCTQFVFSSTDPLERQQKASSLLLFVPMRMTKDSFMSYMKKALNRITIEDTAEDAHLLMDILRQQFDGKLHNGYTHHFDDLRESLHELARIEDSEEFFEDAELINESLDYTLSLVAKLYHMICRFSNLLIFDTLNFENLTDMHMSFYDLYCSLQNILSQHVDTELLLETLPERVEDIKEQLGALYQKECETPSTDDLFLLMQNYIGISIQQIFGFTTGKHNTYSNQVVRIFEDFAAEIHEILLSLPPVERKLRMQYFMSVLPFIMNDHTFENYIAQGFNHVKSPLQNLYTAMYLSNTLEYSGFFETIETPPTQEELYFEELSDEDDEAAHFLATLAKNNDKTENLTPSESTSSNQHHCCGSSKHHHHKHTHQHHHKHNHQCKCNHKHH